jgi:hypothetical protein
MKRILIGMLLFVPLIMAKAYVIEADYFEHDFAGTTLNTDDFTWLTEPDYLPITLTQDDSLIINEVGTKWEKISLSFTDSLNISEHPHVEIEARSTVDNMYKLQLLDTEGGSTYSQFTIDFIGDGKLHTYTIDVSKSWANLEKINELKLLYGDQETNRGQIVIKKLTLGGSAPPVETGVSSSLPTDRPRVKVGKKTDFGYTVLTSDGNLLRGNAVWLWRAKLVNNPAVLEYAFQEEYYQALADSGINFIRLCIYSGSNDWDGATNYNDPDEVDFLLKRTDSVVDFASKYGMYVLLNYHDVGKYTGEYLDSDTSTMGYIKDFWSVFGPYYKNRTHVFYEPANEPAFGSSNFKGALLDSMYFMYDYIKEMAPETHQSLLCITGAVSKSWDSQSMEDAVNRFVADYGDSIDWSKASIAFHPYTSTEKVYSSDPIVNVMKDYAVINTESNYPCDPEIHDLVQDADKQCQTVDGEVFITQTMERLGVSWNQHKSRGWDHFNNNFTLVLKDAREKGYIWFGNELKTYVVQKTATNGYILPLEDTLNYQEGSFIQFEAIPDEEYEFSGWTGDITSLENPIQYQLSADTIVNITAEFTKIPTYTISLTDTTNGTVYLSPGKDEYYENDTVKVTAIADEGYAFMGWKQDFLDDTNVVYVGIEQDITISPIFEETTNIDAITGIDPIQLWPNPVTNELTIQMDVTSINNVEILIFSITGEQIYREVTKSSQVIINRNDINNGKAGVYLLKITNNNESFTKKLVVH